MRKRVLLRRLKAAGNIEYNCSGDTFTWRVKKSQAPMSTNDGQQPVSYARTQPWDTCTLDYVGVIVNDAIYKREMLQARGTPAIVKHWADVGTRLTKDLEDRFSEEFYIDSSGTGNSGRLSGTDTMFAWTQTISVATTTSTVARTANGADPAAYPSDTYANVSTILGNEGGTWNANWPEGKGDAEFDYFSPVIVLWNSTHFDGSSTEWKDNCVLATRYALTYLNRNKASEGMADLSLMDAKMFRIMKDKKDAVERVVINQGSKDREFGIEQDSFYQDGAEITCEFGVPADEAVLFNIQQMKLRSMQDKLFKVTGPEYDMPTRSWRIDVDFLGQLQFMSPRHFGKLDKRV